MEKSPKNKKVFMIVGPTSSGKTSLALDLCKKFNGEIISADSRQVCKFMDIGTGKIPVNSKIKIERNQDFWKLNDTKVWGYDLITPDKYFSGYDFADFALKKALEIIKSGKNVFLVGGTGFYIDLLTGKMRPSKVRPDLVLRNSLEDLSLADLQKKLKKLSSEVFEIIDQKNKTRLVRAIEKELSLKVNEEPLPYLENIDFVFVGLIGSRELLYSRADAWVDEIWKNGLVDEIKDLCDKGFGGAPKLRGLVYREVLDFLEGKISEEDTIQKIKFDIHAYIRRQQTWFKKNKEINWVEISQDDFKEIIYNKVKENL